MALRLDGPAAIYGYAVDMAWTPWTGSFQQHDAGGAGAEAAFKAGGSAARSLG